MIDCNDCLYINMTEYEQYSNSECHICNKYNKILYHRNSNKSYIYPCKQCENDEYIQYETSKYAIKSSFY